MDEPELREDLENLVLDRDAFGEIERTYTGFNIFEAIGHTHAEERHSNFLAFLLDPAEAHRLGDTVLREFLVRAVKALPRDLRPIDLVELSLTDLSETLVLREHRNIDIFGINESRSLAFIVENKIRSTEHSSQLQRYRSYAESQYPGFTRLFIYLTADGDEPSDPAYMVLSYRDVDDTLTEVLARNAGMMPTDVQSAIIQYQQVLRRYVVSDEQLAALARSIYKNHKRALDFIFEQRPDLQSDLSAFMRSLLDNDGGFDVDYHVKTYINFAPKDWLDHPQFNQTPTTAWTKSGRTVALQFRNYANASYICVVVGPTEDSSVRVGIHEACKANKKIFKSVQGSLAPQFATIYSRRILTKQDLERGEQGDFTALEEKVQDHWDRFVADDLPAIRAVLEKQLLGYVLEPGA
jgi:hypothetical protein